MSAAERITKRESRGVAMQQLKGSPKLGQYLKSLRVGYGYSLRKVEEKARQNGGEIDNSQLSRYEKGICYPSFDKLRTLARIFNVSIQTFSDVVDLEELERLLPEGSDPVDLMERGHREWKVGDYGRAYAHYQKVRSLLERYQEDDEQLDRDKAQLIAKARLSAAVMLYRMGKVSLCEYEIRQLLRLQRLLDHGLVVRALLQLSNVHAAFGDHLLAEMEALRSLQLSEKAEDTQLAAQSHHALGRVYQEQGDFESALQHQHKALSAYRELGNQHEALTVKMNLGPIYASRGQAREGIRLLVEAREEARNLGHRRVVAKAGASLAEVHFRLGSYEKARQFMKESNAIASSGDEHYLDVLFLNAYYLWKVARSESNPAEAKIALGRMKYLRPHLEQDLPEVREFDRYIERGGAR